jgi:putative ABC transport system substrate-binding protein
VKKAQEAGSRMKIEVLARTVRTRDDVKRVMQDLGPGDGALPPDLSLLEIPGQMLEATLAAKIPAVFPTTLWIHQGALASYGSDHYHEGLQAAGLVAKILKGAQPRELAVEGAKQLTLALNQETAKAMGITIPPDLLKRADKVVTE